MSQNNQYNTIEEALRDLREGKVILVTDDPDRENEGDLVCAAEFATQENINFMACHAKGLIKCLFYAIVLILFLHLLLPPVRSITHFYPVLLYALHSGPGISSHQIPYSSNNSMVSPPHFPAGSDGVRNFLIYFPTISFSRFTLSPAFFFSSVVSSPV